MPNAIVSDASCLILLSKIGELELLHKVLGKISITEIVKFEFGDPLPEWIIIKNPTSDFYKGLEYTLDSGEASSIGLALEMKDCLLIITEAKGRKVSRELGINISGTLGVILTAKQSGIINTIKPIIEKIKSTNFRISEELLDRILHLANEK
jgi:predicted nucleic acid-binding protein